tara:strand:- start:223 stop:1050 length:828 start_codon:yes stop_codon:yes gene_type:complete
MEKIGLKKLKKTYNFKKCSSNFKNKMPLFVINCAVHKERLKKFKKYTEKAKVKFCRESCVNGKKFTNKKIFEMNKHNPPIIKKADMTPIEVSIVMSHINAWMKILQSGDDYGMVIEDDAEMKIDFKKNVDMILNTLTKNKKVFDILYLWNGNWRKTKTKLKPIVKVNDKISILQEKVAFTSGTVCYIISKDFIKKLLRDIFPIREAVDVYLGSWVRKAKMYSINMTYNKEKDCYISPLFTSGKWVCGGDWGTGQTTQDYTKPNTRKIIKMMERKK